MELPKNYNVKEQEEKLQKYWESEKIYRFDPDKKAEIFSIDTPPPTVSGRMHIGHAFSYSQQDIVVRFQRMLGKNIFYPFGTDDNGLPTERLVEKEKRVRATKMPREEFIKLCIEFLKSEKPRFIQDWKNIGMSCDFDVYYSTIDDHSRKISQRSFIELYNSGREHRKRTPFMWCPECQTAIAQVELEDKDIESNFVYMKFDTSIGEQITIATTRPELLPACVAVHVHPDDKRYKKFIGAKAKIPFFEREVEIYPNEDADPEFGSGVVYHCTFGDMSDVEWIDKFKIKPIEIMNKDGSLNEKAGRFQGLKSKEARKAIIVALEDEGRIEKIEPIKHVVNTHERCGTEIEILMTDQWFIKYLDLKNLFLKAGSELKWYPAHMRNRYDNWVNGLKYEWCISRQRFFGVPFPVWYCKKCKKVNLADVNDLPVDPLVDKPKKPCICGSDEFEPEKDVLDTWATSSLTPKLAAELFKDHPVYKKLYPMSLRPQAHDIITFWLFNTVVKAQLHDKTNPWRDVMISGWALDPHGKKMSKSKGNVVDPRIVLEKYGADCLRFWAAGSKLGEDLSYQEKDLITGQKFVTKLWNAAKFAIMQLEKYDGKTTDSVKLNGFDQWILSKLNRMISVCTDAFEKYEYNRTRLEADNLFWHVFCDNYLEIIKDRIYNPDVRGKENTEAAQATLYTAIVTILKMMAPITPYITEVVWQLYFDKMEKCKSIHISPWPKSDKKMIEVDVESVGDRLVEVISLVRKAKNEANKSLKEPVKKLVLNKELEKSIKPFIDDFKAVTKAEVIEFSNEKEPVIEL